MLEKKNIQLFRFSTKTTFVECLHLHLYHLMQYVTETRVQIIYHILSHVVKQILRCLGVSVQNNNARIFAI